MFFPMGGSVIADIWGQMKSAAVDGAKKVGVVLCTEAAACAQAAPLFESGAKSSGMDVVYNVLASNTQASYTAECLSAQKSGATAVASFVNTVVFARDCGRQNYHPAWINADLLPTLQTIKQVPEFNNIVGASAQWPCLDQSIPATKDLFAALKQYHPNWTPGGKDYDTFADVICAAWAGGVGFAKAIANSGVTPDGRGHQRRRRQGLVDVQERGSRRHHPRDHAGRRHSPQPGAEVHLPLHLEGRQVRRHARTERAPLHLPAQLTAMTGGAAYGRPTREPSVRRGQPNGAGHECPTIPSSGVVVVRTSSIWATA